MAQQRTRSYRSPLIAAFIFFISVASLATAPEYYTVHDETFVNESASAPTAMNPLETFAEFAQQVAREIAELDLMNWERHPEALPAPTTPYNRKKHYGGWVRDARDKTCYNTRAKILIRTSEVPVSFTSNGCTVASGQWHDPYSNRQYTSASDLQIDHVVPLKNSYISGAWQWDASKRCLYGNYAENGYHLLAVNGPDNMRKGDRTPEGFMPPNEAYACEYLAIWLKIKLIWNLALTSSEAGAISNLVAQHQCDHDTLSMASLELRRQRQSILDNMGLCRARQ